jgi:hypothetical protein
MTILNYNQVQTIEADDSMADDYSHHIENALNRGFDSNYPIILDQDGCILDGNHRYIAFQKEDRLDELVFIVVNFNDFIVAKGKEIENGTNDEFLYNDDYFYDIMKSIAQ